MVDRKNQMSTLFQKFLNKSRFEPLQKIVLQIVVILLAFLLGAFVLLATGYSPLEAYRAMIQGAFGDIYGIGQTLTQATPIMFTALAFLFASKCGLFNIGAEGQLIVGAFASTIIGINFKGLPAPIHITLALLAGALTGALWALIPAILKVWFGAHEVITTMMLSYVALYLTSYLVNYPFKAPGWVAQTAKIASSAELPRILPPTQLTAAIFIAVALILLIQYTLGTTRFGYEVRAIGLNQMAAENSGINSGKVILLAMIVSGAIAGLGGSCEILGIHKRFIDGFSPGYGWDGLAVALVGGLNPMGIMFAAILFGALRSGGMVMTRVTGVPLDIISLLQALVVIFMATPMLVNYLSKRSWLKWSSS